jgi:hypothetical protein
MRWSWSENPSLDNMQRTVFCLILVLVPCGGVAAEFSQLSERANAPIENSATSKVTSAKELFGAVTAPAPLTLRASVLMPGVVLRAA